jgi:hypothetical protein
MREVVTLPRELNQWTHATVTHDRPHMAPTGLEDACEAARPQVFYSAQPKQQPVAHAVVCVFKGGPKGLSHLVPELGRTGLHETGFEGWMPRG